MSDVDVSISCTCTLLGTHCKLEMVACPPTQQRVLLEKQILQKVSDPPKRWHVQHQAVTLVTDRTMHSIQIVFVIGWISCLHICKLSLCS